MKLVGIFSSCRISWNIKITKLRAIEYKEELDYLAANASNRVIVSGLNILGLFTISRPIDAISTY